MSIGLYGKLPCQGDFVSRRLPWEFTSSWDDWLQAGMARAKLDIGPDWTSTYLTAPLWRFQLAPGVLGPTGWIGLWFASVDRVGRQFPLALVEPMPPAWQGRYAVIEQDEAFFALEDAALQGLDPRLSFDAFDRSLDGLSLLSPTSNATPGLGYLPLQAVAIDIDQVGAKLLRLPPEADAHAALNAAQAAGAAESCFFTWGNERHAPLIYRCAGLIPDVEFRGFLTAAGRDTTASFTDRHKTRCLTMPLIDIDALLAPLGEESPAGENLEYSSVAELERTATPKAPKDDPNDPKKSLEPEEPEWRKVRDAAQAVFGQTKDLRVAVILTRALLALNGLQGLGEGIQLVYRLSETYWETVHPMLDAAEGDDPVERLNALANLDDSEGLIRSLRNARMLESREVGNYTVRDLDIVAGRIAAPEGTQAPTRGLMDAAWKSGDQQLNADRRQGVEAALQGCNDLIKLFRDRTNDAPSVDTLRQQLKRIKDYYDEVSDEGTEESESEDGAQGPSGEPGVPVHGGGAKSGGALASRADAVKSLQQIALFVRKTEPSSPAPMFIDRAVKLLQSDFATIVKELMPDSKERIEMLGGISLDAEEAG